MTGGPPPHGRTSPARSGPARRLPTVTLACCDTQAPRLALQAMRRCTDAFEFGDVVLFTAAARLAGAPAPAVPGLRVVDVRVGSVTAYSEFMLRGLEPHVRTDHALVVQWDGFVTNPAAWDDAFLDHDYVGAPWPDLPAERAVGNGGFSLRSRRLLQALRDPALLVSHPEDVCICHQNRALLEERHGIRFAPVELASRFAFERIPPAGPTLGFHGLFNLHRALPRPELVAFLEGLPDRMARGRDARDLCKALLRDGELQAARLMLEKAGRAGPPSLRSARMWARYAAAAARRGLLGR
jgi:hypothetical protein